MLKIQKTIINKNGERLIFDDITIVQSFFYLTKDDEKLGLLNKDGIEIFKPLYDTIVITKCEEFYLIELDGKVGLYDKDGIEIFEPLHDTIVITKYKEFYLIEIDGKVGLLNKDGVKIIKPLYDKIIFTTYGCFIVKENNLCGLVNALGDLIVPIRYDDISTFCSEDMIEIYLDEKVGFFNLLIYYRIEPIYDDASDFFGGVSKVKNEAKYGFINKLGDEIIEVKYDYISEFYEDVAECSIDGKFGYISRDGFEILMTEYDEVSSFNNGYGFAKKGKLYICVNKWGKIIFVINIAEGSILCNEKYRKIINEHYEEYIKFDCGLNLIKVEGFYRCELDNAYGSVLQIFYYY